MNIENFLESKGWKITAALEIPERKKQLFPFNDLEICDRSKRYLSNSFPDGIYLHQRKAIEEFVKGKNICITTGTASGKSAVFYTAAIETLSRDEEARVIAIYPLKALGREQEGRWKEALKKAGIYPYVGRIDGQVPVSQRLKILKESNILIMTPDIIHAWLLTALDNKAVALFLKKSL